MSSCWASSLQNQTRWLSCFVGELQQSLFFACNKPLASDTGCFLSSLFDEVFGAARLKAILSTGMGSIFFPSFGRPPFFSWNKFRIDNHLVLGFPGVTACLFFHGNGVSCLWMLCGALTQLVTDSCCLHLCVWWNVFQTTVCCSDQFEGYELVSFSWWIKCQQILLLLLLLPISLSLSLSLSVYEISWCFFFCWCLCICFAKVCFACSLCMCLNLKVLFILCGC